MIYPPHYMYDYSYKELKMLSDFSINKKLPRVLDRLLQYIATQPKVSVLEISKQSFSKSLKDRGNVRKYLRMMFNLNLISVEEEKSHILNENISDKKICMLSPLGTYYLIEKNDNLPYGILNNLLKYQGEHLLFKIFLYPYVTQDSLLRITDSVIFSRMLRYLHECCYKIRETIQIMDNTCNQRNGNLTEQLFVWQKIDEEDASEALRNFLRQELKWDWLEKAEIRKTGDESGITVRYELNTVLITINKEKTKATVSYRGKKYYEFIVRAQADQYTVEVPVASLEDIHMGIFQRFIHARVQELIFSVTNSYKARSAVTRILSKDRSFKKILKDTQQEFKRNCSLFISD